MKSAPLAALCFSAGLLLFAGISAFGSREGAISSLPPNDQALAAVQDKAVGPPYVSITDRDGMRLQRIAFYSTNVSSYALQSNIDVTSLIITNGRASDGKSDKGAVAIDTGSTYVYFPFLTFGSQSIDLKTPLKLRVGDTVSITVSAASSLNGEVDVFLIGTPPTSSILSVK